MRAHPSGLLVPDELSRLRTLITADQWKQVRRTVNQFCRPHQIRFVLICDACFDAKREHHMFEKIRTPDGGFVLRCDHRDLAYIPAL